MDHFAGLDVSVKETSVCIVDDTGRIVREVKVASEPEALLAVLTNPTCRFKRIGLEAGPLSQWLFSALAEAGLPVICVETRHMRAVLKAQPASGVDTELVDSLKALDPERPIREADINVIRFGASPLFKGSRLLGRLPPGRMGLRRGSWLGK